MLLRILKPSHRNGCDIPRGFLATARLSCSTKRRPIGSVSYNDERSEMAPFAAIRGARTIGWLAEA